MFYGSSCKKFPELAGKFTGITTVNKEMPMNILGHLQMWSQGNAMKIGEPAVGLSFTIPVGFGQGFLIKERSDNNATSHLHS
jgi:hypothetical protein